MRKLFYLVVSIVIFGLIISGCIFHVVPPLGQDGSIGLVKDAVSYKTNLIAGQHTVAGFITVSNDGKNLYITYETEDSWLINETHLYVDTIIPTNSAPGKFPYKHEELGWVTTDTYEIPLEDLGVVPCDIVYIAAHAELIKNKKKAGSWAEGVKIRPGKNWAMYFNYQIWPCGSEIPELTETLSQEIDLSMGGTIEVDNPESLINGVKLTIPSIPSKKDRKKIIANITISYIDNPCSLQLPDNRGYLLPPLVINSDILFDTECILEIPYTKEDLSNKGLSSNEDIKIFHYNYNSSSWEEVPINKRNSRAEIDFDYMQEFTIKIDDINETYACSTPSIFFTVDPGFPQPGDLLYRRSNFLIIKDKWIPGHVGIYVGEQFGDHDNNPSTPDKEYNVIEALGVFTFYPFKIEGKVEANYYNPISEFAGEFETTYMGAVQPGTGALTSDDRKKILEYLELGRDGKGVIGKPYAGDGTKLAIYGLARGDYVKGMFGDYNCVGLAEAAYEAAGINLVSDQDEGNNASDISARAIFWPIEQYRKTAPAEGYTVSGQVTDSQGNEIPGVTINLKLVSLNDYDPDPIKITTDSDGNWSSGKLGREWNVTPQKDGYTFEPSTIKVKENASDINFTGTFMTGYRYPIPWSTAESNGWANPLGEGEELITSTAYDYDSSIYLNNHPGKRHMGIDIISELDENVYSIAYGTIVKLTRDYSATSNQSVVIVKHTNSNNENFFAIYGHVLARSDLELNSELDSGETIGVVKESGSPCHLHFGVNISSEFIDNLLAGNCGWGLISESDDPADYGWVEPIDYLNTHQTEAVVSNVVAVYWTDHYPSNSQNIEHLINVFWDPYPEASGYKVYNVVQWHDYTNIVVGNTYSYYVTAYGDGWETAPSQETGTINSFLPPIYLVSPSDGGTINSSTPTFVWSPVGASPGGSINFGTTELWVKDLTDDKVTWDISFNDMTTFNATYNQDGQASPLISGNSYAWEVTSYGSVDNMEVAISQSEYWEFTYGTVTGGPVHNLTKDTYYDTIQAALDDADNLGGDTIEVADGTYDESITFPSDKVIILQSVNGASSTTIKGDNNGLPTITFGDSLEGTTLEDFTITHADGLIGRGIYIGRGYLNIENCNIFGNSYHHAGGGIYNSSGGVLTITESTISDNFSVNQHGSMSGAGIYNAGILTITGSTISGNHASGGGGYTYYGASGGGISNGGILTITGSTISGNYAGGEGGASGGGISNGGTLTISESTISSNYAQSMYGTYGGGISNGSSTYNILTITASTISDNHADYGGGIYLSSETNVTIGGNSDTDLDNFNNFTDNYKSGSAPSADQHICDSNGDCHTYYPNNYFDPGP